MKVYLLMVGKTGFDFVNEGIALYQKRIKHYVPFEMLCTRDFKHAANTPHEQIKAEEGKLILKNLLNDDVLVLLDEKGEAQSSVQFANSIQTYMNKGAKQVVFVIGGAYGFSDEVYARANAKLSLSAMTFSHQIVRALFMEQLYRAFTIIKGEPYHHA